MVTLEKVSDFNIEEILTCGQAFRYKRLEDDFYEVIAYGRRLRIRQKGAQVVFECNQQMYDQLWAGYFDMRTDYGRYKSYLIKQDKRIDAYIKRRPGIRILRQEPFEMLITFILSQNKSMTQIKQLVARLSEHFGTCLEDGDGVYYDFPKPAQLSEVTEETYRRLKVGFRAPYLVDAVNKVCQGDLKLDDLNQMPSREARARLMTVKGVGRKVADCILLFAYHRLEVFPMDVWMKRAVSNLYYSDKKVPDSQMLAKAEEVYGDLAGVAQQYIFGGMDK